MESSYKYKYSHWHKQPGGGEVEVCGTVIAKDSLDAISKSHDEDPMPRGRGRVWKRKNARAVLA